MHADIPELCDNNPETGIVLDTDDNYVIFTGSGDHVHSYRVYSFDLADNDPPGWILNGSNNGRSWKELEKRT